MFRHKLPIGRITLVTLVVIIVVALSAASLAASPPAVVPLAEANKAMAETYFADVLSDGDMKVADAILAPTFARIDRSREGVDLGRGGTEFLAAYHQRTFSGLTYTIDAIAAEGDQVAVCWTAKGTVGDHPFFAAAGEPVGWTGMSFLRIADGQIQEEMTNFEPVTGLLGLKELRLAPSYAQ